jgi:hypothetical protein
LKGDISIFGNDLFVIKRVTGERSNFYQTSPDFLKTSPKLPFRTFNFREASFNPYNLTKA